MNSLSFKTFWFEDGGGKKRYCSVTILSPFIKSRWSLFLRKQSFATSLAEIGSLFISKTTTSGGTEWFKTHIADNEGTKQINNNIIPTTVQTKNVLLFIVCRSARFIY